MVMRVSDLETLHKISEFLPKVQSAGDRIIIEHLGVPVAAVISIQDLARLDARIQPVSKSERLAALARADELCQQILARRGGVALPSSVDLIAQQREEREHELNSLH
ncbi:MAG: hypothetical protein HZC40_26135 [Chloroflexi bacterium]|nr:hypothetical protein [Chloroflexota bacterium]